LFQQGRNQCSDGFFFIETGDDGGALHEDNLAETVSISKAGGCPHSFFGRNRSVSGRILS
jgi:hypothetical protein